jgi:hypothetical protein
VSTVPPATADARRAGRRAVAEGLLASPPPLQDLRPVHVVVRDGVVLHASRSRPVVRWVVTVDLAGGVSRELAVVGKAYLDGGGEWGWRLLHRLRRCGMDAVGLQVPQPYGFDPVRGLVAQEEAPPVSLYSLLDGDLTGALPAVGRVGAWLARLHALRGVGLPVLPADFEASKLTEYATALAARLPGASARIEELTAATLDRLGADQVGPPVGTHGDFQPKNVHLDPDRVVVIDFDRAALAPAARDLGHFIGQTLTMAASRYGDLSAAAAWGATFLSAYLAAGGRPEAVAATPPYVARTFAEVLYYRLVVRPVGSYAFVPAWLDAWGEYLDPRRGGIAP